MDFKEHKFVVFDKRKKLFERCGLMHIQNKRDLVIVVKNGGHQLYEFELLAMTGDVDYDGKEIFDGHILGYGDNYACLVYWDNDEHRWGLHEYYPDQSKDRFHELDYLTEPMKILGHILVSPELLEHELATQPTATGP